MKSSIVRSLARSFGGLTRVPKAGFWEKFKGGKPQTQETEEAPIKQAGEEPVNPSTTQSPNPPTPQPEVEEKAKAPAEQLSKEELASERLSAESLASFVGSLKGGPRSTAKVISELRCLIKESERVGSLRSQMGEIESTNSANHKKFSEVHRQIEQVQVETGKVVDGLRQQIDAEKTASIGRFAAEAIGILDALGKSVKTFDKIIAESPEPVSHREQVIQDGVDMILSDSVNIFRRFGVETVEVEAGKPPASEELVEIVYRQPAPGKVEGEILEVVEDGYTLNGNLIRKAKVGVVKNRPN